MNLRTRTAAVALWAAIIIGAMATDLHALDFGWMGRAGATASDNIYREGPGLEEYGTLLTLGLDVEISEQWGGRSLTLLAGGGWETIESDETNTEEIYRFRLDALFPWSTTGRIEGTAATSRETEFPEPDDEDVDQGRVLTTRSEFGLSMANQFSPSSSYEAGILHEKEEREDRELEENSVNLRWESYLDQRRSISWLATMTRAEEIIEDSTWEEFYGVISITDQLGPVVSVSYGIDFDTYHFENAEGERGRSYKIGGQVLHEAEGASGWTYSNRMGIDHLITSSGDRSWEPRAEVSASGPLTRTLEVNATLSSLAELEDPLGADTGWTRNSQLEAGLVWNVFRTFSIEPAGMYLYQNVHNEDEVEREDKTLLFEVNTRWTPLEEWLLELRGVVERRNSTDSFRDLEERRLELNLVTTYR